MAADSEFTSTDITRILENYDLGAYIAAVPCSAGSVQTTMLIATSSGQFVLRYYVNRSMEYVTFEANILDYLHKRGYHSPNPLKNALGRFVGCYKGSPCMLIGHIEGKHLRKPRSMQLNEIARSAAAFHNITRGYRPTHWHARESHDIQFCWQEANLRAKKFIPRQKATERLQWLEKELSVLKFPGSLPKGVCHCDFHPNNLLFKGNNLSGLIDFDDACYTYLIYDIANLIDYWAPPYRGKRDLCKAKMLIAEYQLYRILSDSEKYHLYDALKMQILIDSVWYFGRGEDSTFIERMKINHLNALGRNGFYHLLFK